MLTPRLDCGFSDARATAWGADYSRSIRKRYSFLEHRRMLPLLSQGKWAYTPLALFPGCFREGAMAEIAGPRSTLNRSTDVSLPARRR